MPNQGEAEVILLGIEFVLITVKQTDRINEQIVNT